MLNWINFISSQLDYIYFFYGFAFIALGVRVLTIKTKDEGVNWTYLGCFGLIHGFNEWLDLAAFSLGDNIYFKIFRTIILIISFIALGEFWRRNCQKIKAEKWIWGVILIIILIVSRLDIKLIGILARHLIALPAGMMGAFFVFNLSRFKKNRHLMFLAILLFVYAILAGLVTSSTWFLNTFLVPIQLLRGICAIWMAIVINNYLLIKESGAKRLSKMTGFLMIMAVVLFVVGWFVVQIGGNLRENEMRQSLLQQTKILGAAINPERVKTLTGTMEDIDKVDYLRIKEQLRWAMEENLNIRYGYLMKEEDDKIIFLASVINKGVVSFNTGLPEREEFPGEVYDDTDNTFKEYYRNSKSGVIGPYTDSFGNLVTGAVPILDKNNGKILALFGMDIAAKYWEDSIKKERLQDIALFELIEIILIVILGFTFTMDQAIAKIKKTEEEMEEKVVELEKINRLMVGRELKMIELKEKLKEKNK